MGNLELSASTFIVIPPDLRHRVFDGVETIELLSIGIVKHSAHRAGVPRHAVASKMRANEISFLIVALDPAYKAGLAGHLPVTAK